MASHFLRTAVGSLTLDGSGAGTFQGIVQPSSWATAGTIVATGGTQETSWVLKVGQDQLGSGIGPAPALGEIGLQPGEPFTVVIANGPAMGIVYFVFQGQGFDNPEELPLVTPSPSEGGQAAGGQTSGGLTPPTKPADETGVGSALGSAASVVFAAVSNRRYIVAFATFSAVMEGGAATGAVFTAQIIDGSTVIWEAVGGAPSTFGQGFIAYAPSGLIGTAGNAMTFSFNQNQVAQMRQAVSAGVYNA